MAFRAVLDTTVVVAAHLTTHSGSPNRELIDRWLGGEFVVLTSRDTAHEYARKLRERGVASEIIEEFLTALILRAELVTISFFHMRNYPRDADDIAFVLCAANGNASHIIAYDEHLLELDGRHSFRICKPLVFLTALRAQR